MEIKFNHCETLPQYYTPGSVYFIKDERSICVASSQTEITKYLGSKELVLSSSSTINLQPNTYHRNTNTSLSSLTITLEPGLNNVIDEYFVEFTTSNGGTTISLPSSIKWANGEVPTFDSGTTYQISIVNNLGICVKFK
jgi:hypothetical protein